MCPCTYRPKVGQSPGSVSYKSSLCVEQEAPWCALIFVFTPFIHTYTQIWICQASSLNIELSNTRVKIEINGLID